MKKTKFSGALFAALLLAGCASQTAPVPTVAPVKESVTRAGQRVAEAKAANARAGQHVADARSLSQRIDDKATVIENNWR